VQRLVKDFFGKDPHQGVNPDEVVAVGAAIQGSVLAGERDDVLLLDVTPLSLGIETEGGIFTKLVERNTTIPTEKKEVFSTAEDNQTAVTVQVFQGERPMAQDNRLLGQFNLDGIPPAPRGAPQIEVKFDVDANGILNVLAKDIGTGKEASVRIEQSSGLSDSDIQRMRREAEQHAGEDKRRRELAEARNEGDQLCYQLEKMMTEHAGTLTDADRQPLSRAIGRVRDTAKGDDIAAIKSATADLQQAAHAFSRTIYDNGPTDQAAQGQPPSAAATAGGSSDEPIDAEFEVHA
jgi:molecular chaperone DnaK